MKTPQNSQVRILRRTVHVAALVSGLVLSTTAWPQEATKTSDQKDHVLFVGTDLAIKQDGEYYHVVGASKDSLRIGKNKKLEDVRVSQGADIRINRGVKLSNLSATIANVKTESVDRMSARAHLEAMKSSMLLADEASMTQDRLHGQMTLANAGGADPDSGIGGAITAAAAEANKIAATNAYTSALPGLESLRSTSNTHLMQNLGRSDSTEVELTFDLSTPEPIENAYIVIVANYGTADAPERNVQQISVRNFDQIDSQPRKVKMSHAASVNGLPFGRFDIGLYANGVEVATNLSAKRMPLTREEAYQFFLIEYLSKHKGETRSPAPILMTSRSEFRRELGQVEMDELIYAKVDKSGSTLSLSSDKAGSKKLPAPLEVALQDVRFMPALENGTPVEGQLRLKVADLAL
ncbi:MAG TPA: hypothetical protein VMM36_04165 [Opitutaceae bacterium]|nr:hypothetical protein [Opitutaceae bacterium]